MRGRRPLAVLASHWSMPALDRSLRTYPAEKPDRMIDYVLYRGAGRFCVVEQTVLDEAVASDHRALLIVLESRPE
jgi:endonuclease/exonuclease/phosphatase (EEP) superfamily protein YafD